MPYSVTCETAGAAACERCDISWGGDVQSLYRHTVPATVTVALVAAQPMRSTLMLCVPNCTLTVAVPVVTPLSLCCRNWPGAQNHIELSGNHTWQQHSRLTPCAASHEQSLESIGSEARSKGQCATACIPQLCVQKVTGGGVGVKG